jgi:hypothetical protein
VFRGRILKIVSRISPQTEFTYRAARSLTSSSAPAGWPGACPLPWSALTPGRSRDADVDPEIRRRTLGDANQAMIWHYTFMEAEAHRAAADVAALIEGAGQ